ncbi:glycosyltransferase family 8 protein [Limosilactobacillus caecicola]|uniref:glycosyltransferase family 8 protein n=1 Tax=Limosilactobacillus caecicola TaxID=2941332 RepID=UPI0020412E9E|nr:glycosyltransferase family 8 protein [Limosilactobacillus caecicola]
MSDQFVFALSGDYGYINQIETTAKSIFYYHHNAKIYIINKDIPQEWFGNINNRIRAIGGQLVNVKLDGNMLSDEHVSQPQINEMSYGRIMIPDLIPEDRVLYLDSDIVVDHELSELFNLDLGDAPIAAVPDLLYDGNFNSGVLLFNMPKLKENPHIVQEMLEAGNNDQLAEGDQSVLNAFFDDTYYHLPLKYNYAIGYDFLCQYYPAYDHDYFKKTAETVGQIIHFTSPTKPWEQFSFGRDRNKWWQYHDLEWSEICASAPLPAIFDYQEVGQLLIHTNSENVEAIEQLVTALPNWTFNVVAWTNTGDHLNRLIKYQNFHLYPSAVHPVTDKLIEQAAAYLDINYGAKDNDFIKKFQATGKPILSFDDVNSDVKEAINYQSFPSNDVQTMIMTIQNLREN